LTAPRSGETVFRFASIIGRPLVASSEGGIIRGILELQAAYVVVITGCCNHNMMPI